MPKVLQEKENESLIMYSLDVKGASKGIKNSLFYM